MSEYRPMGEQEQVEMMQRAAHEIRDLRSRVAQLQPKAEAYDNMAALISVAISPRSMGMAEDLAWALERRAAGIEQHMKQQQAVKD